MIKNKRDNMKLHMHLLYKFDFTSNVIMLLALSLL